MLSYGYPEALASMGSWVAENAETENIRYVVHTGDITDNGFKTWQWDNFDLCYGQFRDMIPYFPVAGNHDLGVKLGDYSAYLERPFFDAFPPENLFEGGKALYAELQVSGVKLLLIGACWGAELEALEWMQGIIAAHDDYDAVILLFHAYIRADGSYMPIGAEMYEQLVLPYPNVRLVLSGHVKGRTGVRIEDLDDDSDGNPDRRVHALMYNHNQSTGRHAGFLRILKFDPALRSITVTTYSPFSGLYYGITTSKIPYLRSKTPFDGMPGNRRRPLSSLASRIQQHQAEGRRWPSASACQRS